MSTLVLRTFVLFLCLAGSAQAANLDPELSNLLDIIWLTLTAMIVFFMQSAFALLESGMSRTKNAVNVMMKNYFDVCIALLMFSLTGYCLMYGDSLHGWFGTDKLFMAGVEGDREYAFILFNAMFAATAATISSGAMAERTKYHAYVLSAVVVSGLIYPLFAHWAWNDQGWLKNLGFVDFAGSTVVHSVGAWVALAGIIIVGPRMGRFDPETHEPRDIRGHNLMLVTLGGFIFWFGFFAFNTGSTGGIDSRIGIIALNTGLAGAAGAFGVIFTSYLRRIPLLLTSTVNGSLAGLVSIAAGCATTDPLMAIVTGLVAGCVFVYGREIILKMRLDDVVDAIAVHGISGFWGTLAAGLFFSGDMFNPQRIMIQVFGIVIAFAWVMFASFIVFGLINKLIGLRADSMHEQRGLDYSEHNEIGYPEFQKSTFRIN
ncbi:MAG: ammonium transporter [Thiolinea sp.]